MWAEAPHEMHHQKQKACRELWQLQVRGEHVAMWPAVEIQRPRWRALPEERPTHFRFGSGGGVGGGPSDDPELHLDAAADAFGGAGGVDGGSVWWPFFGGVAGAKSEKFGGAAPGGAKPRSRSSMALAEWRNS
mmetsp:Transcript_1574/g.6214  ORF Transcript_1574/g.6214 Transcript_1574/m.6214 type:complete len:133 (+) Transcript_1574:85-483(+)